MSRPETEPLRVLIANERKDRLTLVAAGIEIDEIGGATRRERPDVALVALGESSEHALELIGRIVHEAACPVIALLHVSDPGFVNEAAKRGVFAHITDDDPEQLQSTLDIVLHRFAGRRLIDLAEAVVQSHRLLAQPHDR